MSKELQGLLQVCTGCGQQTGQIFVMISFLVSNSHFRISPFHLMTYTEGNPHLANSKTLHISISHHWPEDDSYNHHILVEISNAKQNPEELMPKYLSRE